MKTQVLRSGKQKLYSKKEAEHPEPSMSRSRRNKAATGAGTPDLEHLSIAVCSVEWCKYCGKQFSISSRS